MDLLSQQKPRVSHESPLPPPARSPYPRSLPSVPEIQQLTTSSSSGVTASDTDPGTARLATLHPAKAREVTLHLTNENEDEEDSTMRPPPAYNPRAGGSAPSSPASSPGPSQTGVRESQTPATPPAPASGQYTTTAQAVPQARQPGGQEGPMVVDSSRFTTLDFPNGNSLLNINALYSSLAGAGGLPAAAGEMGQLPQPHLQPQVHILVVPQDHITASQTLPRMQQQSWRQGEGYGGGIPPLEQHLQSPDLLAMGSSVRGVSQTSLRLDADAMATSLRSLGLAEYRHPGMQNVRDRRTSNLSTGSFDSSGTASPSLFTVPGPSRSTRYSGITSISEHQPAISSPAQNEYHFNRTTSAVEPLTMAGLDRHTNIPNNTLFYPQERAGSDGQRGTGRFGTPMSSSSARSPVGGSGVGAPGAVILTGALKTEMTGGRDRDIIDNHLVSINRLASSSDKEAQKLVTAGVIPALIGLFKTRAVDGLGLEIVLVTLGMLVHDPISANTIFRSGTINTIMELINNPLSDNLAGLCIWFLTRLCRSNEVVNELIKLDLVRVLINQRSTGSSATAQMASWCLGGLVRTDATADAFAAQGLLETSAKHLKQVASSSAPSQGDICAAIYAIARLSRSIKLAKGLAQAGCVPPLVHCLNTSTNPTILRFSARAVGCMMRPNSADISKILLDAGAAKGLARLPQVLSTKDIEPLESFAFAIQRFSCAEWGSTTRKALVEAGVVDSLLAALRTAADEPFPQTHIELALAVSFLGDVGGAPIRKEVIRAGGIDILKRVSERGNSKVAKTCDMAVTSITGNLWTRNAASIKTAMSHNWSGGCPDHQPSCPPLEND